MSVVCGLDLSLTSAGVAILVDGTPKVIKSVGHKGRDGDGWQHRSRRVRSQCRAVLKVLDDALLPMATVHHWEREPDLAVIEGPSYGSQYGDQFDRAALWHGVYGALEARHVPIAVIAPSTLKLWFTGNGGTAKGLDRQAEKRRMLDTARLIFREPVTDDDQADALALTLAGAHHLGDPMPPKFQPNQRQVDALLKIDWPEVAQCH